MEIFIQMQTIDFKIPLNPPFGLGSVHLMISDTKRGRSSDVMHGIYSELVPLGMRFCHEKRLMNSKGGTQGGFGTINFSE